MPVLTRKLDKSFYLGEDVVKLARMLIGTVLVSNIDDQTCAGIISETEAYAGAVDRASHAYGNRRTARTETMYAEGGCAYVYLCYGVHHLFNVVTNQSEVPHAILIRSLQPVLGIETMARRRGLSPDSGRLCSGPGTLSRAMGFHTSQSGISLLGDQIWIEEAPEPVPAALIMSGPRIGVGYAGEDALLPYRFRI